MQKYYGQIHLPLSELNFTKLENYNNTEHALC